MPYVDGYVTPVPTSKKDEYIAHARKAGEVLKEHGALKIVECWGDDVPEGKVTSFPMAVQRKDDETVVFSWMVWASREARDHGWEKIMKDPRMTCQTDPTPFDGKRLIYGGFDMVLDI
jgi:uncharacterized protein YbaA (DUF1428 family)